ncbi:AI-2E family transporter [Novosphingobium profundi]|uniref:AI-2E family transporter n=1 Tax=Novosphingobium profundi TaxID=1774954 RepID=UPI001CFCE6EC|nr:AI-2E family transporter [Novosphingobium profundi]
MEGSAPARTEAPASPPAWTPARVAVAVVTVLAVLGIALLLVRMVSFLLLVFAAIVLGVVFDAITRVICRHTPLGRGICLTLAVLLLLGVFAGAFYLFGAQLAAQFDMIRDSIPGAIARVEDLLDSLGMGETVRSALEQGREQISGVFSQAGGYVLTVGSTLTNLVLVVAGAVFLAANPDLYRRGFLKLIPKAAEPTAAEALDDVGMGLNGWMKGQVVSSIVVALLSWIGLELLGVPSAAGLGVMAGLLDVIPMLGPVIAGFPAVLLAFTVSPMTALWTLLLYLLVQQLQGNVLQPMIQKQAVNIPPAILLFAVLAAGMLFGFLGVLLASPLTITAFVLVQRIYVKTLLDKDVEIGPQEA